MIFYKATVEEYDAADDRYFILLDNAINFCKNYKFKKNFIDDSKVEWFEDPGYFEYDCGYTDHRFTEHAYVEKLEMEDEKEGV